MAYYPTLYSSEGFKHCGCSWGTHKSSLIIRKLIHFVVCCCELVVFLHLRILFFGGQLPHILFVLFVLWHFNDLSFSSSASRRINFWVREVGNRFAVCSSSSATIWIRVLVLFSINVISFLSSPPPIDHQPTTYTTWLTVVLYCPSAHHQQQLQLLLPHLVRAFCVQILWLRDCGCAQFVVSVSARKLCTTNGRAEWLLPAQWLSHAICLGILQLPVLPANEQELWLGHTDPHPSRPREGQGAENAKTSGSCVKRIICWE